MKSVTICGSGKFKLEARKFAGDLRKLGVIVYEPHYYNEPKDWENLSKKQRELVATGLTYDHFNKINLGDVFYLYNKNGYSGNSSTLEIGYAVAKGKPIYVFAEDSDEICRNILFREVVKTPKELLKKLK